MRRAALLAASVVTGACALEPQIAGDCVASVPVDSGARQLHERLLVLDTHLDTPMRLEYPGFDVRRCHDAATDYSQVDLPRMRAGGLDGGFWVIFTEQKELTPEAYRTARDSALLRASRIRELVARNGDAFELATTADDAGRIAAAGKRVVYQSIENAYPLGEDLSLLKTFFDFGVRMVGPVHSKNNQFADSSSDKAGVRWGGLSPLGRELVAEANRLGIVLDASHAHDLAFDDMLELSATPLILSHSGPRAVFEHDRNLDDERLKRLTAAGGVIHVNALGTYLTRLEQPPGRTEALTELYSQRPLPRTMTLADEARYFAARRQVDIDYPPVLADFEDYMRHLLYVLDLVGPDHVGIGADWDGGGGVNGLRDVASVPRITERLLAAGYSETDIEKIWSGNVLRLLREAAEHAATEAN